MGLSTKLAISSLKTDSGESDKNASSVLSSNKNN